MSILRVSLLLVPLFLCPKQGLSCCAANCQVLPDNEQNDPHQPHRMMAVHHDDEKPPKLSTAWLSKPLIQEAAICQQVYDYFSSIEANGQYAIVFDIDETLIFAKSLHPRPFVQELYNFLKDKNFIIFIISARLEKDRNANIAYLAQAGYKKQTPKEKGYKECILMPENVAAERQKLQQKNQTVLTTIGTWKESVREKITKGDYTDGKPCKIICTIDDCKENLKGKHVGLAVKIPCS